MASPGWSNSPANCEQDIRQGTSRRKPRRRPFLGLLFNFRLERFDPPGQKSRALIGGMFEKLDQGIDAVVFEDEPVWQFDLENLFKATNQGRHAQGVDIELQQRAVGVAARHELFAQGILQHRADLSGHRHRGIRPVGLRRSGLRPAPVDFLTNLILFYLSSRRYRKFIEDIYPAR